MSNSGCYTDLKKFNSQIQKKYLCINGGTMNGNINMSGNDIINLDRLVFNLASVPTTDPGNQGEIWRDASGFLRISQ